ncbi:glycosyltransferase [Pseudoalteromonas byunsanensis]|uniref:Glycosyl transferase family 1 domain-containing protein n=1 Tax=Pseudoalteromonas byunsanensis TaxID=327939 RepID=A0A1S1N739_9GAMM|nr:glycosyltransferase [Pseudoalteromonas byunsanensis]OHU95284.1 hypothetical protein BIW53_11235 [Pseudoalteromonas byunsanensis]
MKVTFFLGQFPVSSETFVISQIVGLIERGLDVEIVAISQGDMTKTHSLVDKYKLLDKTTYLTHENANQSALQAKLSRIGGLLRPSRLPKILSALNYKQFGIHSKSLLLPSIAGRNSKVIKSDVFIAHFGTAGVVAEKMRRLGLLEGKILTIFHGADISVKDILNTFSSDYKRLFVSGEGMLPISNLWQNKLIELGCSEQKITVNRMGINVELFRCREFDKPLYQPLRIISVARFIEKKGLQDAINAMRLLKEQGVEFEYQIVGDGPLKEDIVAQIEELKLSEEIKLLGFQPQEQVTTLLEASDVFLLPSVVAKNGDMEGIPVALMEAMAMGLITVSTFHSGIPELIKHEVSGLLVNERSPNELAQVLINLSANYYPIATIRKNAQQTIYTQFNQSKLYDELAEISKQTHER